MLGKDVLTLLKLQNFCRSSKNSSNKVQDFSQARLVQGFDQLEPSRPQLRPHRSLGLLVLSVRLASGFSSQGHCHMGHMGLIKMNRHHRRIVGLEAESLPLHFALPDKIFHLTSSTALKRFMSEAKTQRVLKVKR